MDNRFPPSDNKDDRRNGPDLSKESSRNDTEWNNQSNDPYRNEMDNRGYDDRTNPPFSTYDDFSGGNRSDVPLKHSGVGIASFVLGLLSIVLYVVFFISVFGAVVQIADAGGAINLDPNTIPQDQLTALGVSLIVVIASILGAVLLNFVGTILGIIGIVSKTRKRVFAIIGTVINGLCLLGGGGFIVIATVQGAAGL
ncbi:hypothetical protein [Saccharibacillus sp. JS10]|uniref:hypothetical protein n=1 Tax=Saccharibacillus sp. JS10 TaxID=2950552 RepID=UPI00210D6E13|nr:hypothetical protein [Saccharibacillus sp. JS10]MCQ4086907.1 hypothetical protein [Saccharibacillus sp. JS10]